MSEKLDKKEVDYSMGKTNAHCGICVHYREVSWVTAHCTEVRGNVWYYMWCRLFKRK